MPLNALPTGDARSVSRSTALGQSSRHAFKVFTKSSQLFGEAEDPNGMARPDGARQNFDVLSNDGALRLNIDDDVDNLPHEKGIAQLLTEVVPDERRIPRTNSRE